MHVRRRRACRDARRHQLQQDVLGQQDAELRRRLRDRGLQVHLHGHAEATATWAAEAGSISAAPSSASTKPYATPRSISAATFAATT